MAYGKTIFKLFLSVSRQREFCIERNLLQPLNEHYFETQREVREHMDGLRSLDKKALNLSDLK